MEPLQIAWLIDRLIDLQLVSRPYGPDACRPQLTGPLCPISIYGSPVALLKFQMAPRLILLVSSGSKKKEPRYACLSEAKASHSGRMWAEVSSSAPHLLHSVLSDSPIRWRCLLRVLCPVRSLTALDCVLLKDRNLALAPTQGPEINSRACLWVSPGPHKMPDWINRWINKFRVVLTNITAVDSWIVRPIQKQRNGLQLWEGERRRNYGQAHALCRPEFVQVKKYSLLGNKYFINFIFAVLYTSLA